MSPTASVRSTSGSLANNFRSKLTTSSRAGVEIVIDGHSPEKIYTTFDAVTGVVHITAPQNVPFDTVRITLEGSSKTFLQNLTAAGTKSRSVARHRFLELVMPVKESDYPHPRIAEAGVTYSFSFNFNIPEQLLPRACTHEVESNHVQHAHLQLPPALGEKIRGPDDLAPDMSKISYVVTAAVLKFRDDGSELPLIQAIQRLRVIPAVAEAPPLSLVDDDSEYTLSKTKTLRKGIFSGTLGRITVSAAQTSALVLPPPGSSSTTSTMATLHLRFYPSKAISEPPKLGGITTKIKASTFFSIKPLRTLASFSSHNIQFEGVRGAYSTTVPISSLCVEAVSWTKHEPQATSPRRGSDSTTCSDDSENLFPMHEEDALYYAAKIFVPITLPSTKTWVPTFHSCVISRVYTIDLALTIRTPGTGVPSSSVSLHLPVQIASAGNPEGRSQLTAAEAAAELASANEFFVPRVIEIPDERLTENSVLRPAASAPGSDLPPNYSDFNRPQAMALPGKC